MLAVKMRRLELGLSQEEVGKALGITKVSYGRLENGKSKISVDQLKIVCEKLGLDFHDLDKALPMQAKTAPVPVTEYTKVVNQLMDLQKRFDDLQQRLESTRANEIPYRIASNSRQDALHDTKAAYSESRLGVLLERVLGDSKASAELEKALEQILAKKG